MKPRQCLSDVCTQELKAIMHTPSRSTNTNSDSGTNRYYTISNKLFFTAIAILLGCLLTLGVSLIIGIEPDWFPYSTVMIASLYLSMGGMVFGVFGLSEK
jgi:hypothetical protein